MKFTAKQFESLTRTCKDPNAAEKAAAILNDEFDPEDIPAVAKWVAKCYHRPSEGELKMAALDAVLEGFGVEAIRVEGEWVSHYHGDLVASYVNQGDTYTETVVHDHETDEFHVTSWGDWLEKWESEHEREVEEDTEEVEAE